MPIIVVGNEKGGSGKTTIATNLAVMRQSRGHSVVLMDTDAPQYTSSLWSEARNESVLNDTTGQLEPILTVQKSGKLAFDVVALAEKYDTVVIDVGGRESIELRYAVALADQVIIPTRPSQFDTWTLDSMERIIKDSVGNRRDGEFNLERYKVVLTQVNPNPQLREADEVRLVLAEYAHVMTVLPFNMYDRVAVRKAQKGGLATFEAYPEDKAATEMQYLYESVFGEE
ncbi:division plane positioning ATPase MipZ [Chitinimonas sp. BJB300]|nr:division plane positioning ATPase MipZ [Chitinimonas sp. BJB300]